MQLQDLGTFVTVAAERSFSVAAKKLHRTQPAVSQAIRRLEAEIGETLFDRSSKDGTLTFAGEVLVGYGRQMLNLRNVATNAIKDLRGLHKGKVTISANEHTVFCLLPVIRTFREQHPNIKVEVQRGVASRIPKEITAREVELGVISFRPNDDSLRSVPILIDELKLVVSPGHPLADRKSVSVRELGGEIFIAHNAVSPYRRTVIETFEKNKTTLNIAVELPSLEAIKRLVETGAGVALMPKLAVASELESGRLVGLSVKEMKLERKLNIVYRKNSVLSHAAEAFLKTAREMNRK